MAAMLSGQKPRCHVSPRALRPAMAPPVPTTAATPTASGVPARSVAMASLNTVGGRRSPSRARQLAVVQREVLRPVGAGQAEDGRREVGAGRAGGRERALRRAAAIASMAASGDSAP